MGYFEVSFNEFRNDRDIALPGGLPVDDTTEERPRDCTAFSSKTTELLAVNCNVKRWAMCQRIGRFSIFCLFRTVNEAFRNHFAIFYIYFYLDFYIHNMFI